MDHVELWKWFGFGCGMAAVMVVPLLVYRMISKTLAGSGFTD